MRGNPQVPSHRPQASPAGCSLSCKRTVQFDFSTPWAVATGPRSRGRDELGRPDHARGQMKPLHVAFVWHMHQPYYKDDLTSSFLLPWVRLRAAKDYYKMPALLDDYPAIKQTFNLVPALVTQVQDYVDGGFQDVYLDLARRPVSTLTGDERSFIARWMT